MTLKFLWEVNLFGLLLQYTVSINYFNKFFLCRKKIIIIQKYVKSHAWFSRNIPVLTIQHLKKTNKSKWYHDLCCSWMEQMSPRFYVKLIYSKKTTKFCEISNLHLSVFTVDKSKVEISQNFVASSEYTNFKQQN